MHTFFCHGLRSTAAFYSSSPNSLLTAVYIHIAWTRGLRRTMWFPVVNTVYRVQNSEASFHAGPASTCGQGGNSPRSWTQKGRKIATRLNAVCLRACKFCACPRALKVEPGVRLFTKVAGLYFKTVEYISTQYSTLLNGGCAPQYNRRTSSRCPSSVPATGHSCSRTLCIRTERLFLPSSQLHHDHYQLIL